MIEQPPPRAPTIYDVAAAAGVAASTVSRAFSRPGRVNFETAERIRQVATALGYRTNPLARALSTGRTSMIAVIISDVTNPFYNEIIRGAQSAAAEASYTMLLADAQESDREERDALDRALPIVEGVVLATSRMSDSAIRKMAKQKPMIVLNRSVSDVPSVVTDNPRGIRRAAAHLAELGHRRITYVAGPEASWADRVRWRSLREAAQELELQVRRIGPFPAVIGYNDQLAIGLIRGLTAMGARVPADVSVIGFDNIFAAELITPRLTTVAAPLRTQGVTGARNLLAIIGGATPRAGVPVVLPVKLVVRRSTAVRADTGSAGPCDTSHRGGNETHEICPRNAFHVSPRKGLPRVQLTGSSGRGRGLVDCLKLDRCQLSQSALSSFAVVGPLDPSDDRQALVLPGAPPLPIQDISLQQREEALHRSVIGTRTDPAHRPEQAVVAQRPQELLGPELRTAIGVQHTLLVWPGVDRGVQRPHGQCGFHVRIDGVTDDPVGPDVFDRAEVQLALVGVKRPGIGGLRLLDFDQGLVGPFRSVERGFELRRWHVTEVAM